MATIIRTMTGMATTIMPTEPASTPALLRLLWLASPALPIGGFSYSEGLEAAIANGRVYHVDSAIDWLQDQLLLSQARGDLSVLAAFVQSWPTHDSARLSELNQWVQHTRESVELRLQTEQMGRSLLDWLRHQSWADDRQLALCQELGPTYPLVMGLALACTQAPVRDCLRTFAFGWAENMVQAAIKSVPLGQTAGQHILARLAAHIDTAVDDALQRDDDTRQAFTPMLAILSAQHETQYSRLFRS